MQDASALLCLLLIGLQIIDYELTTGIIRRGGVELNPLLRRLMERMGVRPALISAKLIAAGMGWILAYHGEVIALAALSALYLCVCAWNWRALHRMR